MNKQRFLAELKRLLIFMTDSDRDITIQKYSDMFDQAGEEGEASLVEELGSPTKLAISLSRGYAPGAITNEAEQREALKKAEEAAAVVTAKSNLPEVEDYTPAEENTPINIIMKERAELKEAAKANEKADIPEANEEQEESSVSEEDVDEKEQNVTPTANVFEYTATSAEEEPEEEKIPYHRVNPAVPGLGGYILLALILLFAGIPLMALTLSLCLICLAPAAVGIFSSALCGIGGLWCMQVLADSLVLFGIALVLLGIGVLLLWVGIWAIIKLFKLYRNAVIILCDWLLGKKEALDK